MNYIEGDNGDRMICADPTKINHQMLRDTLFPDDSSLQVLHLHINNQSQAKT